MTLLHAEIAAPIAKPIGAVVYLGDPECVPPAWDAFAARKLVVVVPQGGPWWLERGEGTALFTLRTIVLPELRAEFKLPIALIGVGRGGAGALTLAFRLRGDIPVVFTDAAAVDLHEAYGKGTELDELYTSREACRQDGAILAVDPFRTPHAIRFHCPEDHLNHRGNDRLHEKLAALGIDHTWSETTPTADEIAAWMAVEIVKTGRKLM